MRTITTKYGTLTPQHTADDLRKKEILPVVYHDNGQPRTLPLEAQTVITTPAGDIPAELVSFHENGSINRVFPLNGKLSGYWSEADEMALAQPLALRTPAGTIAARIISVGFYDNEKLHSITLWPGETVTVSTPAGRMEARIGISFSQDGTIRSLEPASPTPVATPVGEIMAYDPEAIGVCGDSNSLILDTSGSVQQVRTTQTQLTVITTDGKKMEYTPQTRESYCSEEEKDIEPLTIHFSPECVSISHSPHTPMAHHAFAKHTISTTPCLPQFAHGIGLMNCSL